MLYNNFGMRSDIRQLLLLLLLCVYACRDYLQMISQSVNYGRRH